MAEQGEDTLTMVGPLGDTCQLAVSPPVVAVAEVDGVRLISNDTCQLLRRVPAALGQVFSVGSTEPGKTAGPVASDTCQLLCQVPAALGQVVPDGSIEPGTTGVTFVAISAAAVGQVFSVGSIEEVETAVSVVTESGHLIWYPRRVFVVIQQKQVTIQGERIIHDRTCTYVGMCYRALPCCAVLSRAPICLPMLPYAVMHRHAVLAGAVLSCAVLIRHAVLCCHTVSSAAIRCAALPCGAVL